MPRKLDFTKNIEKKIRNVTTPQSLSDFLDETPSKFENAETFSNIKFKREEFRLPVDMSEKLRAVAYKLNKKKTDIVQEALNMYFDTHSSY